MVNSRRGSKEEELKDLNAHKEVEKRLRGAQQEIQDAVKAALTSVQQSIVAATLPSEGTKLVVAKCVKESDAQQAVSRVCDSAMRVTKALSEAEEAATHLRLKEKLKSQDLVYKMKMESVRSASRMQLAQQEASLSASMRRDLDAKLRRALEDVGRGDMSDILTEKEKLEVEVRHLKERNKGLDEALLISRSEASDAQSKLPGLRASVQRLEETVVSLREQLSAAEERAKEAHEAFMRRGSEYDEMRGKLYEAQAELSELKALREEHAEARKQRDDLEMQLAWALEAKELADTALEAAKAEGEGEMKRLREQAEMAQQAMEESLVFQSKLAACESELERTKEAFEAFKSKTGDMASKLEELDALRGRVPTLEAEVARLEDEASGRQEALQACESRLQESITEALALRGEVSALKEESAASSSSSKGLREAHERAKARVVELEERLRQLEADMLAAAEEAEMAGEAPAPAARPRGDGGATRMLLQERDRAKEQLKEALERLKVYETKALSLEQMIETLIAKHKEELQVELDKFAELAAKSSASRERQDLADEAAAKANGALVDALRAMDQSTHALEQLASHSKQERASLVATAVDALSHLRTHLLATLGFRLPAPPPPFDATPSFKIRNFVPKHWAPPSYHTKVSSSPYGGAVIARGVSPQLQTSASLPAIPPTPDHRPLTPAHFATSVCVGVGAIGGERVRGKSITGAAGGVSPGAGGADGAAGGAGTRARAGGIVAGGGGGAGRAAAAAGGAKAGSIVDEIGGGGGSAAPMVMMPSARSLNPKRELSTRSLLKAAAEDVEALEQARAFEQDRRQKLGLSNYSPEIDCPIEPIPRPLEQAPGLASPSDDAAQLRPVRRRRGEEAFAPPYHDPRQDLSYPSTAHTSRTDAMNLLMQSYSHRIGGVPPRQVQHQAAAGMLVSGGAGGGDAWAGGATSGHPTVTASPHGPKRSSTAPDGARHPRSDGGGGRSSTSPSPPSVRSKPVEQRKWVDEVADDATDEISLLVQRDATQEASKAAVRARAYAAAASQEARLVRARIARLAKQKLASSTVASPARPKGPPPTPYS